MFVLRSVCRSPGLKRLEGIDLIFGNSHCPLLCQSLVCAIAVDLAYFHFSFSVGFQIYDCELLGYRVPLPRCSCRCGWDI